MPTGIQIFDSQQNLIIDYTTRIGRFLGSFTTNGSKSGAITDPLLVGQDVLVWPRDTLDAFQGAEISFNKGTGTISWTFSMNVDGLAVVPPYPQKKYYYGAY